MDKIDKRFVYSLGIFKLIMIIIEFVDFHHKEYSKLLINNIN